MKRLFICLYLISPSLAVAQSSISDSETCEEIVVIAQFVHMMQIELSTNSQLMATLAMDDSEDGRLSRLLLLDPSRALVEMARKETDPTKAEKNSQIIEFAQTGDFDRLLMGLQIEPGMSACSGFASPTCEAKFLKIAESYLPNCPASSLKSKF